MEHTFSIDAQDFAGAAKLSAMPRIKIYLAYLLLECFCLLAAVSGEGLFRYACIAVMFFVPVFHVLFYHVFIPFNARQQYKKYTLIHHPFNFSITEHGYILRGESGVSDIRWTDLVRWKANDRYILMYIAPNQFHLIPKRLSEEGLDIAGLEQTLLEHLGPAT